jgi:hypothetical protein
LPHTTTLTSPKLRLTFNVNSFHSGKFTALKKGYFHPFIAGCKML